MCNSAAGKQRKAGDVTPPQSHAEALVMHQGSGIGTTLMLNATGVLLVQHMRQDQGKHCAAEDKSASSSAMARKSTGG